MKVTIQQDHKRASVVPQNASEIICREIKKEPCQDTKIYFDLEWIEDESEVIDLLCPRLPVLS